MATETAEPTMLLGVHSLSTGGWQCCTHSKVLKSQLQRTEGQACDVEAMPSEIWGRAEIWTLRMSGAWCVNLWQDCGSALFLDICVCVHETGRCEN